MPRRQPGRWCDRMQVRLGFAALFAMLALAACQEEEVVDLQSLGTGERTIRGIGGSYDLAFSLAHDGCTITVTQVETIEGGTMRTRAIEVDLDTIDMARIDGGTWDNGSLGRLRLFAIEDQEVFRGDFTLVGTIDPQERAAILEDGGMCDGDTCQEDFTTAFVEVSIRGPNPPENVQLFTDELRAQVATCAAAETG